MTCPPLEWHPAYRDRTWLLEWLNGDDHEIKLAMPRRPGTFFNTQPDDIDPWLRLVTLTKQRASAPAPWAGEPFYYEWYVATDELGRAIAGEARRVAA